MNKNAMAEEYFPKMERFARTMVPESDAEDVCQEILLRLISSFDSFKGESSFRTWAYSIGRRTVADFYRKQVRFESVVNKSATVSVIDDSENIALESLSLEEIMNQLSEIDRETLTIMLQEGLSFSMAADFLQIKYENIRSRYRRAIDHAKQIAEEGI